MKDDRPLTELVCRRWCRFYRESAKEELTCAGYDFFRGRLKPDAVSGLAGAEEPIGHDPRIERVLCARCGFRAEDCDFMAEPAPAGAVPCGGYVLLARLLAAGRGEGLLDGQD
jgi:hypothetical protein